MDLKNKTGELKAAVRADITKLNIANLADELEALKKKSQEPDFWKDNQSAQKTSKKIATLQARITPWLELKKEIDEADELAQMGDKAMEADLQKQLAKLSKKHQDLRKSMTLAGPYDDHDVILTISAGAGGTDAQDWASMLLRMYTRWAESHGCKTTILEESAGEEAGHKSASLQIAAGEFLYGKLAGEHGVHRLVRLSPFNAKNLRQTSFARVEILPKIDEPEEVPIDDGDLKIDVFRAGGHGGQSVNTTDSAVRVTHLPTDIVVSIQNERSQIQNKETALSILRSKLAALQTQQHAEKISQLKGPSQSAEWGSQIRSYVLHPYTMVKDLRTKHETNNTQAVLDGDLDPFIEAWLNHSIKH